MKKWLLLCLLAWWPQVSRADDVFSEPCARAGIPRELAVAIARQESSLNHLAINIQGHSLRPRSVGQALDYIRRAEAGKKSYDVGLMQINNQWFGKLALRRRNCLTPKGMWKSASTFWPAKSGGTGSTGRPWGNITRRTRNVDGATHGASGGI